MTLTTALSQSCDTYFYDVGNRYYDTWRARARYWTEMQGWAKKFGFGAPGSTSAARRPASSRRRPGARRPYKGMDRAWNPGDLIQMAIGRKDMAVTALQMARFYAAIANSGDLVTPYVVSSVEQPSNDGRCPSR